MKTLLYGGRILSHEGKWIDDCPILIEEGIIRAIGGDAENAEADQRLDVTGKRILPGLCDVHTHGRIGYDFSTADAEQMMRMKEDYARHGVTTVFPTLASDTLDGWKRSISTVQSCGFDGIHLEGRYLNPAKRGAHPEALLAPLDANELDLILSEISIPCHVSAAFELDRDGTFSRTALAHGATLGIGHTEATTDQTRLAIERGVSSFTHLYNTMPPLNHRAGGAVSVALTGNQFAELIVDGFHVAPEMVALAYRCLGKDRLVLISDSMEATCMPDGDYAIAGQPVKVENGRARTLDGAVAGSTLNLWDGVLNLSRFAGIPLEDAVTCATLTPARMMGIADRVGSIEIGKRADLLIVKGEETLVGVISSGVLLNT